MSNDKICSHPFRHIEIYENGDVMPCCMHFCKNYSFGNLYDYPLSELIHGDRARAFHEKILLGDYSNCNLDICKSREQTLLSVTEVKKNYYQCGDVSFPEVVTLGCDLECNVACSICRDKFHRNSSEEEKKLEQLTANFLPYLGNCKTLYLSGGGDPFGSRYARRLIRRVVETYPQIRFQFITNGVLLTHKLYTSLGLKKRTSGIFVSVHAATEVTYNQMVRGGNFHHLMRNLEWLAKAHSLGEIPSFIVLFVVTDLNFREMPAFAELAERLGAEVHFTAYRPHGDTTFAKSYAERAVFEKEHPAHLEFLATLAHPALGKAYCQLEPRFKRLRTQALKQVRCVLPPVSAGEEAAGAETQHSSRGLAKRLARIGKNLVRRLLDSKEEAGMSVDLQGLNIREYQAHLLNILNARYSFQGKRVLEIGSDIQLQTAKAMLRYGAEQVWALNPAFADHIRSPDPRILPTKTLGERSGLPDACADIIFGIALLEHVHDPVSLAQECRRLLKPGGLCFLQGNPLWASYRGHHIYLQKTPSGHHYLFDGESNPLEPWEHLGLDTDEKAQVGMRKKGFPEEDIPVLCNHLLRDPHISRLLAADIVAPFYELEGMVVDVQRTSSGLPANAHFASALAVYSEDDLRTDDLRIYLTYDADDAQKKNIIPVGPGAMPAFYLMQGGLRTVSNQSIETLPLDYPHMSPQTVLALLSRDFVGYAEGLSYNAEEGHWKNTALSISFNHDTDCGPQDRMRLALRLHERADRFRRAMQSGVPALFVFSAYHMKESAEFIQQLLPVLRKWREDRPFTLVVWGDDPSLEHLRDDNLAIVRVPYPFAEVQDWWKPEKMQSPEGQTFLSALMDGTRNAMKS